MASLIFAATLANNPRAIAQAAHRSAKVYLTAVTGCTWEQARARGLREARENAEEQRRDALGLLPIQVAQACERIRTAHLTPGERAVWFARRALTLAEHNDTVHGAEIERAARQAVAAAIALAA